MRWSFKWARDGRRSPRENGRLTRTFWSGGMKVTQEQFDPAKKRAVLEANKDLDPSLDYTLHSQYTTSDESSSLAVTAGMGLDYKLNSALAIRVANFEYLRSGARNLGGVAYNNGFQMTTGMVLRLGTW